MKQVAIDHEIADPANLDEIKRAAWELSTYAASIHWDGSRNTPEWLAGLHKRILTVQGLTMDVEENLGGMMLGASAPKQEELWSDERIDQEVLSKIDEFLEVDGDRENDTGLLTASSVDRLMQAMRDEYEAERSYVRALEEATHRARREAKEDVARIVELEMEVERLHGLLPDDMERECEGEG